MLGNFRLSCSYPHLFPQRGKTCRLLFRLRFLVFLFWFQRTGSGADPPAPDSGGREVVDDGPCLLKWAKAVASQVKFPPGYYVTWSGQFEYLERAKARLQVVVPVTVFIIFLLLALSQFPSGDRDPDRHAFGAVRAGRRPLADVVALLQPVGRRRGRFHRACRCCRRNRRRDADLSRSRLRRAA
jgi:hypothetical protein